MTLRQKPPVTVGENPARESLGGGLLVLVTLTEKEGRHHHLVWSGSRMWHSSASLVYSPDEAL